MAAPCLICVLVVNAFVKDFLTPLIAMIFQVRGGGTETVAGAEAGARYYTDLSRRDIEEGS